MSFSLRRFAARAFSCGMTIVLLAGCSSSNPNSGSVPVGIGSAPPASLQQSIQHIVVIYQENWSFDGLYGSFPGANGLANATNYAQVDKVTGAQITSLPQPIDSAGTGVDPNFPAGLPVKPYSALTYVTPSTITGDLVHRFYQEQSQIDGGKMDGFVSWSDNPGLTFSYFDGTQLPEGQLAMQYTMADNFFHSAFGGSFLNHQWLICACTPVFPNAPASKIAQTNATGNALALNANGQIAMDGFVTPDGYDVNTSYTVNQPHPASVAANVLVPEQTNPTIGDRMDAANVTWKWYSGGWDNALAGNPDPLFQFHHQPFAYYKSYADGTAAKTAHLQDETHFLSDLKGSALPQVSFIKPLGTNNEHPGYSSLLMGQQHVASLVSALQASPYWKNTVVIITYDENGGRWDHVAPPGPFDRWGPGTRVPTIVISPYAKHGFVDHTQYETTSILALIEKRFGLAPLSTRDAAANPFSNAFDFTQKVSQ